MSRGPAGHDLRAGGLRGTSPCVIIRTEDDPRTRNTNKMKKGRMTVSKKQCACRLKKPLIVLLVLALVAFIGWLVYYFFFADDCEELDETLFKDDGKKEEAEPAPEAEAAAEA